jgi:type IV pilus biogenesis protein PilP
MSTKALVAVTRRLLRRVLVQSSIDPVFLLVFLIAASVTAVPRLAQAQDLSNPTAADYVAAKNRVAMARIDAELAKIQRDAKGEGKDQPQGGSTAPYGGYLQSLTKPSAPVEPTVQRVKATSDGKLIAMIALGNGTVIPAWAGKNLGRGIVVESVTTSDVIVKDSAGVHPLAWGDVSSVSGSTGSAMSYGSPSGVPMGPMGLTPPPSAGN